MKWLILACGLSALCVFGRYATAEDSRDARKIEERFVPLSEIVTMSPQEGMIHTREVFPREDPSQEATKSVYQFRQIQSAIQSGASDVFLVDGANIYEAIRASARILLGSRAARTPAPLNIPNPSRGNYWLVVYLGAGPSDPTWWTVDRVSVSGKEIRITYQESPPTGATRDINLYYYWIPIGPLEPGIYKLELYDAGRKMVSLMRRVEVVAAK